MTVNLTLDSNSLYLDHFKLSSNVYIQLFKKNKNFQMFYFLNKVESGRDYNEKRLIFGSCLALVNNFENILQYQDMVLIIF
jgi:hypothetical protein